MATATTTAVNYDEAHGTVMGHPKGLFVLFFTEMWERFSYYGMRALLVLYMTQYLFIEIDKGKEVLGFNALKMMLEGFFGPLQHQALSSQIYGLYTGFVYFTPFFGGLLADRILGQRKSVYLGGALMAIGHFLMAVESMFFPALFFLILGNGAFKPNISTQVGNLYPEGDARRDSAFTIFYMGINLGAFFSPLVCGTLGQVYGWHYGFGAAGIGMLIGLLVYHFGKDKLPTDRISKKEAGQVQSDEPLTKEEWQRIWALVILCAVNVFFWGIFEQQGNTLQLWADKNTDWSLFGLEIPSTWYQSFNPAMIFIFAPLMNILWGWQNKRGKEPSSVAKMGIGCLLCGIAYIVMVLATKYVGPEDKGSIMWLAGTTWLFTMGELYLSPIGLSLVTKVSPARIVSMMMGMWFLSSFFGNYASGLIGGFYDVMPKENFFLLCTGLGVAAGLIFFAAQKPLNKVIGKNV
jgi:proton-dependent oligopeptide transporter, POT family